MLKSRQVVPYDKAAADVRKALDVLNRISTAHFEFPHRARLNELTTELQEFAAELFHLAHERFCAERAGDLKPGE